jgi:hypothetical protein
MFKYNISLPKKKRPMIAIQKKALFLRSLIIDKHKVSQIRKNTQKNRVLPDRGRWSRTFSLAQSSYKQQFHDESSSFTRSRFRHVESHHETFRFG